MSRFRRLNVFFSPPEPAHVRGRVIALVDTARASTTLTTLIAGGAAAVYPVPSDAEARALAKALPGVRLCGERGGQRIAGFDFGNSPSEFAAMDVRRMRLVQTTSNGTRAAALAAHAAAAFVVCLRNRAAAVQTLRDAAAPDELDLAIVCAGEQRASAASVEDAFTAGALVALLLERGTPGAFFAESGARLALRVFDAYVRDPQRALADAPHANYLKSIGYAADIQFVGEMDCETVVPRASVDDAGRIVVRR
jgi:2-phosphosulfolactate phosphatase